MFTLSLYFNRNVNRTLENLGGGDVALTENDLGEIELVLKKIEVLGTRYPSHMPTWG